MRSKESAIEAIESGIKLVVVISEFVPIHDTAYVKQLAIERGVKIVGPNTIGVISPGKTKVGIMPGSIYSAGPVGVVARSGTLTHDIGATLTGMGIGQTTCMGIGGDPIRGMDFIDVLKEFAADDETKVVVMVGEIGGTGEELAAQYLEAGYPETGDRLHRRADGARRKEDGPCGRDHLGRNRIDRFEIRGPGQSRRHHHQDFQRNDRCRAGGAGRRASAREQQILGKRQALAFSVFFPRKRGRGGTWALPSIKKPKAFHPRSPCRR